jgi:outer membrane protein TolC
MGGISGMYKTSYRTGLTVTQPLFVGGKIVSGYQMARYNRMQTENSFLHKLNDVRHQVVATYFNILKLKDMRELVSNSLKTAELKKEQIALQQELGLAKRADYLQWQVRIYEYKKTERELSYNLEMLLELYNNLLGLETPEYTPAQIDYQAFSPEINNYAELEENEVKAFLQEEVSKFKQVNPLLKNLDLTQKMLETNRRMAKGNFLPSLSLQFNYEFENDDKLDLSGDKNWNIAAVLSMPLFKGGSNYADLRKSREELRQVQFMNSVVKDHYERETRRLSRQLVMSALNVSSSETAYEYAAENYKILSNLFEQNMLTNSDFLDAESLIFSSKIGLISAYFDFIITKYELEKYTTLQEVK